MKDRKSGRLAVAPRQIRTLARIGADLSRLYKLIHGADRLFYPETLRRWLAQPDHPLNHVVKRDGYQWVARDVDLEAYVRYQPKSRVPAKTA